MAKKINPPIINASVCIRSLTEYNQRIYGLLNIMDHVVSCMKECKHDKPEYKNKLVAMLEEHYAGIKEFQTAIPEGA